VYSAECYLCVPHEPAVIMQPSSPCWPTEPHDHGRRGRWITGRPNPGTVVARLRT
jgi:hypothetical protein